MAEIEVGNDSTQYKNIREEVQNHDDILYLEFLAQCELIYNTVLLPTLIQKMPKKILFRIRKPPNLGRVVLRNNIKNIHRQGDFSKNKKKPIILRPSVALKSPLLGMVLKRNKLPCGGGGWGLNQALRSILWMVTSSNCRVRLFWLVPWQHQSQ